MVGMIKQLPNRFNTFNEKKFAVYLMDDYGMHLMAKIRREMYNKGSVLTIIGGGITDNFKINDKHCQRSLTSKYREYESMLKKLE